MRQLREIDASRPICPLVLPSDRWEPDIDLTRMDKNKQISFLDTDALGYVEPDLRDSSVVCTQHDRLRQLGRGRGQVVDDGGVRAQLSSVCWGKD